MRKLKTAGAALALAILTAIPGRAGYIDNYQSWMMLGPDGQSAYAMALFDTMSVFIAGDEFSTARALGLRNCAKALNLKAGMMAQAITKYYQDYPENQVASPFVAFNGYLERGACSPFINEVRREMGLPEVKKQ